MRVSLGRYIVADPASVMAPRNVGSPSIGPALESRLASFPRDGHIPLFGAPMPFFVLWEDNAPTIAGVSAARRSFATREEAEDAIRLMTEKSSTLGHPTPDYRIVEAPSIGEAFFQVTGVRDPLGQ